MDVSTIVYSLMNGSKFKLAEVDSTAKGIYGLFDKGKLVYVGVAKGAGGFRSRIRSQHASGNSCVSSFCNYLRSEKGITISTEEVKEFIEIDAPVKIEELKVQDYLDKNVYCRVVEIEDDKMIKGIERELLDNYFPNINHKLWNFATKRSNKITLEDYRKRLKIT